MKLRRDQFSLHLRTSRDGVLSPLGHDLDLLVDGVDVTRTQDGVVAIVDPASVRVHGVMKNGALSTAEPQQKDRIKIESNIQNHILKITRYPEIRFEGTVEAEEASGELTLCGVTRPLSLLLKDGVWEGVIHQPDFGIEPYRALMGQLRVAANVTVLIKVAEGAL